MDGKMNGQMNGQMDGQMDGQMNKQMNGGRRHRGSKKRHGNSSLRAWVKFVKKVQREEKVSYKEAMMRAKKRKDDGEKWRGGGNDMDMSVDEAAVVDDEVNLDVDEAILDDDMNTDMEGGKRRRRTRRRRGSKKRRHGRKSRKHR